MELKRSRLGTTRKKQTTATTGSRDPRRNSMRIRSIRCPKPSQITSTPRKRRDPMSMLTSLKLWKISTRVREMII